MDPIDIAILILNNSTLNAHLCIYGIFYTNDTWTYEQILILPYHKPSNIEREKGNISR